MDLVRGCKELVTWTHRLLPILLCSGYSKRRGWGGVKRCNPCRPAKQNQVELRTCHLITSKSRSYVKRNAHFGRLVTGQALFNHLSVTRTRKNKRIEKRKSKRQRNTQPTDTNNRNAVTAVDWAAAPWPFPLKLSVDEGGFEHEITNQQSYLS